MGPKEEMKMQVSASQLHLFTAALEALKDNILTNVM